MHAALRSTAFAACPLGHRSTVGVRPLWRATRARPRPQLRHAPLATSVVGQSARRVSHWTRAVRSGPRKDPTQDPSSRHYVGRGSRAAWRKAEEAAKQKSTPSNARGPLMLFAAGVVTAGSVGVMIYNVYTWTRARGSQTMELLDVPLVDGNPLVFFDLEVDGYEVGRVVMQLRADVCPVTAENFRLLVTEELGYGFRMTRFHKVNEPDGLYGGDFMSGTGDDSVSVFASGLFKDENFVLNHNSPGLLSMANEGAPHTNGSRFCISLRANPEYNGKRVVFGNVVRGMEILWEIARSQNILANSIRSGWIFSQPVPVNVVVRRCGQLGWVGADQPDPPELPPLRGQLYGRSGGSGGEEAAAQAIAALRAALAETNTATGEPQSPTAGGHTAAPAASDKTLAAEASSTPAKGAE